MKKIVLGCFVAGAMAALSACSSSDPCATFYAAQATEATNIAPCLGDAGIPNDGGTQATCDTVLNASVCTSADKTALETAATSAQTCITTAGVCAPATFMTWNSGLSACTTPILLAVANGDAGVSAACYAAISVPGGL